MIYIVTKGKYSDYHVIAATTDRTVAEKIAKKFTGEFVWDECRVEEFPDAEVMLRTVWKVYFKRNGDVWSCIESDSEYDYEDVGKIVDTVYKRDYDMIVKVEADTETDAIKIAAEKRAEYLAAKNNL